MCSSTDMHKTNCIKIDLCVKTSVHPAVSVSVCLSVRPGALYALFPKCANYVRQYFPNKKTAHNFFVSSLFDTTIDIL